MSRGRRHRRGGGNGSGWQRLLDAIVQVRPSSSQDLISPADRATGESSVLRVGPVWEGRDIGEARPTLAEQPGDPAKPYFVPLLLRMGEANVARRIVQSVDYDRATPRLVPSALGYLAGRLHIGIEPADHLPLGVKDGLAGAVAVALVRQDHVAGGRAVA